MSFTRFHDDPNRIQKTNLETSAINDYTFNVPNSVNSKSVFFSDPHVRMQKNGTTLCRNMVLFPLLYLQSQFLKKCVLYTYYSITLSVGWQAL